MKQQEAERAQRQNEVKNDNKVKSGFRIMCTNIDGLISKKLELEDYTVLT